MLLSCAVAFIRLVTEDGSMPGLRSQAFSIDEVINVIATCDCTFFHKLQKDN